MQKTSEIAMAVSCRLPVALIEEMRHELRLKNAGLTVDKHTSQSDFIRQAIIRAIRNPDVGPLPEPPPPGSSGDWFSLVERFSNWMIAYRAKDTIRNYTSDMRHWADWATVQQLTIGDVTHSHIETFMGWMVQQGCGARTVNRKLASLRFFWRFLRREGVTDSSAPKDAMRMRQRKAIPNYATAQETDTILSTLAAMPGDSARRDEVIVGLLALAGLRCSEAVNLKIQDVSDSSIHIVEGKGAKDRLMPVIPRLREIIDRYKPARGRLLQGHHSDWFCVASRAVLTVNSKFGRKTFGQQLSRHAVTQRFIDVVRPIIGRRMNPHALRHSFATRMRANGAELQLIQECLGHADISTTTVYAHMDTEGRAKAVTTLMG